MQDFEAVFHNIIRQCFPIPKAHCFLRIIHPLVFPVWMKQHYTVKPHLALSPFVVPYPCNWTHYRIDPRLCPFQLGSHLSSPAKTFMAVLNILMSNQREYWQWNHAQTHRPLLGGGFVIREEGGLPATPKDRWKIVLVCQSSDVNQTMVFQLLYEFWVFLLHSLVDNMAECYGCLSPTSWLHLTEEKQFGWNHRYLPNNSNYFLWYQTRSMTLLRGKLSERTWAISWWNSILWSGGASLAVKIRPTTLLRGAAPPM